MAQERKRSRCTPPWKGRCSYVSDRQAARLHASLTSSPSLVPVGIWIMASAFQAALQRDDRVPGWAWQSHCLQGTACRMMDVSARTHVGRCLEARGRWKLLVGVGRTPKGQGSRQKVN